VETPTIQLNKLCEKRGESIYGIRKAGFLWLKI